MSVTVLSSTGIAGPAVTPPWPTAFSWPTGFLWGAATAATQIEGAAALDGKSESIWDRFAAIPGNIDGGDTPAVAADHYHRMPEDVALMKQLGLDSYRFSVNWTRVKPDDGVPNAAGLAFYDHLVDELLEAGILPWLTLYHWDLPQSLEDIGGWTNRDVANRFVDYAVLMHDVLGDRIAHWTTFNEPFCSSLLGYVSGEHAPGRQDPRAGLAAMHHQHLAHGYTVTALRELGAEKLGITLNLTNAVPNNPDDAADREAARRLDAIWNGAFLEPLVMGNYPEDFLEDMEPYGFAELVHEGDLAAIRQPLDFLGVNHYHDDNVSAHPVPAGQPAEIRPDIKPTRSPFPGAESLTFPARPLPRTAMGWEVHPAGLTTLLVRLGEKYGDALPPLYITENGSSWDDEPDANGFVTDTERTDFLDTHIAATAAAIAHGADVRGYFVWSLLDNFEWAWGYAKRFGVVRVDYATQERIVKASGRRFASLILAARAGR